VAQKKQKERDSIILVLIIDKVLTVRDTAKIIVSLLLYAINAIKYLMVPVKKACILRATTNKQKSL
jgi:hypothetical protein